VADWGLLLAVFSRVASRLCETLLALRLGEKGRRTRWACESGVRERTDSEGRYEANEEYGWVRKTVDRVSDLDETGGGGDGRDSPLVKRVKACRRDSWLRAEEAEGHRAVYVGQ
jgi:hypothetical protein